MSKKTKGALIMVSSALCFAIMQVPIALTADRIPLFQQLFFRNLITAVLTYFFIRKWDDPLFGKRENWFLLSMRSFWGYFGMITTFYAAGVGNQGDVNTIIKMSPFLVTLFSFLFLKETITKYQIMGLFIATAGVCFISNPEFNSDMLPLIVAGLACAFNGVTYTLVAALKGRERPEIIIFFFSTVSTLVTLPLMCLNYVPPTLEEWWLLLLIGVFAGVGQVALTYGYAYAKASEVSIYNYTGIVFSMLLGYFFLGQAIKFNSIIGAGLVIGAGLIVFFGNKKLEHAQYRV